MKNVIFRIGIPLMAIALFLSMSLAFAGDNTIQKARGKVYSVDYNKRFFVLNESEYFWTANTTFSDESGADIKIDRLVPNASVHIEWEYADKNMKKKIAKWVFINPKGE